LRFVETPLRGAFVMEIEPRPDDRGYFARTYCEEELAAQGVAPRIVQCNVSFNHRRGTLRGLHYQIAPHEEAKIVSCIQGAIFDVIVDLRAGSPTYGRWTSVELTAASHRMLYVPEGFAHGFQTLTDEATVYYQMSAFYRPEAARGLRWDDPALGISWPLADPILSPRDAAFAGLGG
jgi:dTDP-4-dehydrorhamnose 3,5-epimerase